MAGSRVEVFLKEIVHFHYMTYIATPLHKNPCPRVIKFLIFVDPTCILSLSVTRLGVEKKIFEEIMHFHYKS